jgi:nitric oxide reductase subunit B
MQACVITFLFGFAILGYLAIRVYEEHPPVPGRVVSETGQVLFTGQDVRDGQELFLTYGLMQYGSIYGHGAYLGPDFTADYLHRQAMEMQTFYGGDAQAEVRVREELRANRYDAKTDSLTFTPGQIQAFGVLREHYEQEVLNRQLSGGGGLGSHAITDREQSRKIVAFIAWTAWTASAQRPGRPHSYTNNWPPEPLVGNSLTQEAVVWSTLSIIALLGGIGLLFGAFGRYSQTVGWHSAEERRLAFVAPADVGMTPAQRATAWYFFVVAALFLVQTLLGGATAHYHAETGGFFGFDLAR